MRLCQHLTCFLLVLSPPAAVSLGQHHQQEHGAHGAHSAPEAQHAPWGHTCGQCGQCRERGAKKRNAARISSFVK